MTRKLIAAAFVSLDGDCAKVHACLDNPLFEFPRTSGLAVIECECCNDPAAAEDV